MAATSAPISTTAGRGCGGRANSSRSFISSFSASMRVDDFLDHRRILAVRRQPAADDLNRAPDAGQRVLDFVGDDGRHLAKPRERGLFAQLLLDAHARAQVVKNAGELSLAVDDHFADREVQRKRGPVPAKPGDLPARSR